MRIYFFLISIIFITSCAVKEVPMETLETRACLNPLADEELKIIYEEAGDKLPRYSDKETIDKQNKNLTGSEQAQRELDRLFWNKWNDRKCPDGSHEWLYEKGANLPFTGIGFSYWRNGFLKGRQSYKNGLKDGVHEWFYDDGSLSEIINYKNGKNHGLWEEYIRGKLEIRMCFQDGKRVSMLYCE